MPSSVINSIYTPESTSSPVVHEDLANTVDQIVQCTIMRFATSAQRTQAFEDLDLSPQKGAVSYLEDAIRYDRWTGTAWVPMVSGVIARGRRESNSTATTTSQGVLRIDNIPFITGLAYRITAFSLVFHSSVANDVIRASIFGDFTGAAATTGSTLMGIAQERIDATANPPAQPLITDYYPSANVTGSLLLAVSRQTGTGNGDLLGSSTFPIAMLVELMGPDPGDTGTDI